MVDVLSHPKNLDVGSPLKLSILFEHLEGFEALSKKDLFV